MGGLWLLLMRDRVVPTRHAAVREFIDLAKNTGLRRVAMMHFLLFGGYLALLGMLARSLIEAGITPAKAGLAVAGWLVAAAVGNFMGPWLSDRIGLRKPFLIGGAILASASLALLALNPTGPALYLLAFAALGGGCFAPLLLTLPLELPYVGAPRVGAALGLLMLVGQVGGFLLPLVVGVASQNGGFSVSLALLAGVHALIVIPALRLSETGRRAGAPVDFTGVAA